MQPIRVVLVDMPGMLHEIIEQAVAEEPGLDLVDIERRGVSLRHAVERSGADFVIAGADYDLGEVALILEEHPRLRVLAVVGHGREAFLYELRPSRTPLGAVSPRAIVEAIRGARHATS